jgi:hypothetical protein
MSTDGSSLTGLISLCRCCYSFREVNRRERKEEAQVEEKNTCLFGCRSSRFLLLPGVGFVIFFCVLLAHVCDLDFYFPPVSLDRTPKSIRVGGRRCIEQKGSFYLLDGSVRACGLTAGMIDHWRKENIDQVETDPPLQPAGASRMKMKEILF